MAYAQQQVIIPNSISGVMQIGIGGFPTTYRYQLISYWLCLGPDGLSRVFSYSNTVVWGEVRINNTSLSIRVLPAVSQPAMLDAHYAIAVGANLTHILISLDSFGQVAQVYANDVPLTPSSGGTWVGAPSNFHLSGPAPQWNLGSSGSAAPGAAVGDFYSTAPTSFFDLATTANRRKFINADLTPVDLGSNASSVTGTVPYTYLTVRPGGVPYDFATNNGSGGPFHNGVTSLAFEPPGFCILPVPAVPPSGQRCGTATQTSITPTWDAVAGATSYTLQYRETGTTAWTVIGGITASSYLITGLTAGKIYEWQVATSVSVFSASFMCRTAAASGTTPKLWLLRQPELHLIGVKP
jgi:hypothetical protein